MIRNLLTILLVSVVFHSTLEAQHIKQAVNIGSQNTLTGVLRDLQLDERIPFGKVALFQEKKLVRGEDTDMSGQYIFKNIPPGLYQVKASFYGYDFVDISEVKIEGNMEHVVDLDLEVIDKLHAPIAVVAAPTKYIVQEIVCYGIVLSKEIPLEDVSEVNLDKVSTRSKPGPFERAPFSTPIDLLLYPNPSTGIINIQLEYEQLQIELINPLGQNLGAIEYNEVEKNKIQIDLSVLAAGTYFLNIIHNTGSQIEKVVIVQL